VEAMPVRKVLLVYNPLSGHRSVPKRLDDIISRFMDNDIMVIPYRIFNEDQDKLLNILKNDDFHAVIISGGDGTVNTVINTMLKNDINLPLGIIPSGTCNDFARSLNIPIDLNKCLDIILEGNITEVDVGLINNEKYFFNTCAGGVFVDVSYSTSGELKKNLGPLAYYLKGVSEVANLKPIRLRIEADNETVEQDFILFVILNGKHVAGFTNINEEADLSDGFMDIILIKYCLHIELVGMLLKVISQDFLNDKNVMWIRTSKCKIYGPDDFSLSVDGERWKTLPISVEFINKKLKIFSPGVI